MAEPGAFLCPPRPKRGRTLHVRGVQAGPDAEK
eukprot:COSAG05_NODE_18853_length_301_cov_1.504950_1_plen_32_part_10